MILHTNMNVRDAFDEIVSGKWPGEFNLVFQRLLSSPDDLEFPQSPPREVSKRNLRECLDSKIGYDSKSFKKKKRLRAENNGDVVLSRDMSKPVQRHVWVVLSLDLVVCTILFGIWLLIFRGFKCIAA